MGLLQKAVIKEPPQKLVGEETVEGVRAKIAGYHQLHTDFQGIVLAAPGGAIKVSAMAGELGLIVLLPSKRFLILFPPALDRELIAHRLSMSLRAEVLVCFDADNPDKALELIQLYL
jgi:hypothetical protein